MKKFFTLISAVFVAAANVNAQTVTISKTDGTKILLKSNQIEKIEFGADKDQPKFLREFMGYILFSTKENQNQYYGYGAKVSVYNTPTGKVSCIFKGGEWSKGYFDIVMDHGNISGKGVLTIARPMQDETDIYDAKIEGSMTNFKIIAGSMGDTIINWVYAKSEPLNYATQGIYEGTDNISVASQSYASNKTVGYQVTANADGTINLMVPQISYENTLLGTIVVGTYTIPNIPYVESEKAFVKAYKDDKIPFHFKSNTMDGDYVMDSDVCRVVVRRTDTGYIELENNYQVGKMPFPVKGTFKGVSFR